MIRLYPTTRACQNKSLQPMPLIQLHSTLLAGIVSKSRKGSRVQPPGLISLYRVLLYNQPANERSTQYSQQYCCLEMESIILGGCRLSVLVQRPITIDRSPWLSFFFRPVFFLFLRPFVHSFTAYSICSVRIYVSSTLLLRLGVVAVDGIVDVPLSTILLL